MFTRILAANKTGTPKTMTFEGEEHLVIPCIFMIEGVMNGLFYAAEDMEKYADLWNGVPVPVNHPVKNNENTSINDVKLTDKLVVGQMFNVKYSDKKLSGELYINKRKAEEKGFLDVYERLEAGEVMEVSSGLQYTPEDVEGEIDGEKYTQKTAAWVPDHMALLPEVVGACSVEKGCGTMKAANCKCQEPVAANDEKSFVERVKAVVKKAFNVETSTSDISDQLQRLVTGGWVCDVFDTYFIYAKDYGKGAMKAPYTVDEAGIVSVDFEAETEVVRNVQYVEKEKGSEAMANEEAKDDVKANAEDEEKKTASLEDKIKAALEDMDEETKKHFEGLMEKEDDKKDAANAEHLAKVAANSGISVEDLKKMSKTSFAALSKKLTVDYSGALGGSPAQTSAANAAPVYVRPNILLSNQ